jgi:type I restriction enzyme S subunit
MNPVRLLQHFDRISEAPDAIPRLRRFILDLAVRGKLVEQDPKDEPATELLKRIQAEKARLVKEEKIKQEKPIQSRANGSMPIELPKGWLWGCMQEICTSVTDGDHIPPPKSESGIPFLVIGDVRSQSIDFSGCRYVPDAYYQQLDEIRRPTKGDILYTLVGSYGIPVVVKDERPFCVQRHIGILRPSQYVNVDCLARILASRIVFDQATRCATGIAQKTVPLAGLRGILIPLPPLAEQHRIVAKVDELMALCDQLEAAKTEREQSRDRLVAASLHRLNSPADTVETDAPDLPALQADAFHDHARFVFNHLSRLTTRLEHIKQLRQTILNLAVRGKLVTQDPNDEPVGELLHRVTAERQGLIAKGRLKAQKSLTTVDANPPSQPIPATWKWVRLADLISSGPQNGISPKPTNNTGSPKALTLTATTSGFFDARYYKHVDMREADCQDYWLSAGDVLFQRGNTREYVGIAAVFDGPEKSFVFPDLMIRVRFAEALSPRFIHMALISPLLRRYFSVEATGASSSMPKISQGVLLNAPIPLSPLAEQHRIVARVDELMALCDQLEAQITATEADSRRLLEAVLHEALNPLAEVAEQIDSVADRINAPQN